MSILYTSSPTPLIEVLYCTEPFEFKPHIHDRYVVWINTGCGEHYSVKGSKTILQPGSISIFEPGLVHSNNPCSKTLRQLRSFYIEPAFFHDLAAQLGKPNQENYFTANAIKDRDSWKQLSRLHNGLIQKKTDLETDTHILEVFFSILNRHGIKAGEPAQDRCDKRVRRIIDYFHANLDHDIRLKDLAEMAGCTEFHLIRLFKNHKGMSPHAFLVQLRLEHARRLIENGTSIVDAALSSGFADQSHLSRKFKNRYGLAPYSYKAIIG